MHDIKLIRTNPEEFEKQLQRRNIKFEIKNILKLDQNIRLLKTKSQELQEKRNNLSKQIGLFIKEKKTLHTFKMR